MLQVTDNVAEERGEAITGDVASSLRRVHSSLGGLLRLCAIYIPLSLLIGVVLRRPVIWLMNFFEHQAEKTGLM